MQIKCFEFNPVSVNTYLLFDETQEAVLIDCGTFAKREQKELSEFIDHHHLTLKHLLNTHLHFDHQLGNPFIYDTYGLQPEYHEGEETLPGIQNQLKAFGLPFRREPIAACRFLQDGDEIHFGHITLKALLMPGHSPASLSFYCEQAQCVFTGDTLFCGGIGRTDLWGGSEATLLRSIRTQLLTLPDDTAVYPGHGPASTIRNEKQTNPYIQ
jgi:glyoxylase-like metal-dependent hydrolase (beta-lactamase superfamily II)